VQVWGKRSRKVRGEEGKEEKQEKIFPPKTIY
jgi:hypothetical protein